MMEEKEQKPKPAGAGSFCIPRSAFNALLNANATVYEICAYLVLARFTGECGRYSTASIHAVNNYTGANKTKGGTVDRAINRLKTIRVTNLGSIVFDRETWHKETGEILPDGPHERTKILHVLPDFEELPADRIWFGNNIVSDVAEFNKPLKSLKYARDVAARLLLYMYAANDMETWGGVRPIGAGRGPWNHYELVADDKNIDGGARLIRAKNGGEVASIDTRITGADNNQAYFTALSALKSTGLAYEVVLVLNRNGIAKKFDNGSEYTSIPDNAEPRCELDCRSQHGYKPEGEEGISAATATTARDLGYSVALEGGQLDGTYAAIVPTGFGTMITGIYRLRFRVANSKNAGVKGTWARIHQNNRDDFNVIQNIRAANKLAPLTPPWETIKTTKATRSAQPVAKSTEMENCPF